MKTKNDKTLGKVYPFRHNLVSVLFSVFALLLCGAGAGISIFRIVKNGVDGFLSALQSPFLLAVCVFCAAVVLSILIKSEFIVTKTQLITRFGFIKSRLELSTITSMEHDRGTHKLTVYCKEEYSVFTLKQEWEDDLVHAICAANPNVNFSFTMTENKPPKDEPKNNHENDKTKKE